MFALVVACRLVEEMVIVLMVISQVNGDGARGKGDSSDVDGDS